MHLGLTSVTLRRGALALACALALALVAAPAPARAATAGDGLPAMIDASIPDEATLVSPELAVLPSGEVVTVADGQSAGDADLLGTPDTPPDPLDVTGGERFAQMSVGEARAAIAEGGIRMLTERVGESIYGAYWGTYRGEPAFFMKDGTMFASDAVLVIDVSEHNSIDWAAAKAAGVQGAIIRIGFGTTRLDYDVAYNISECERLGIPYGVYLYSYAETPSHGTSEGEQLVAWLRKLGVDPGDLDYPVYYDLEKWSWTGHTPPTDPAVYEQIVRSWADVVSGAGYDVAVYSYTNYLYGPLNSDYIHSLTNWVAQYGPQLAFTDFGSTFRGWQYTSSGTIAGISGNLDLNAFGTAGDAISDQTPTEPVTYDVTVGAADGGSVAASPAKAEEGQVVTLSVTPSRGQRLAAIKVTDGAGADVALTTVTQGSTYTFVMPARSVSVTASFVCDGGSLCPSGRFPDVDQTQWYHLAVDWAVERGAMNGYDNGLFGPEDLITRAQIAGVLYNLAGNPDVDVSGLPSDCDQGAWYAKAVAWALEEGVMNGYGDGSTFGPDDPLTREQAACVLYNLAGKPYASGSLSGYADAGSVSSWARGAMTWAVSEGVINGYEQDGVRVLSPGEECTRAMLAAVLSNWELTK